MTLCTPRVARRLICLVSCLTVLLVTLPGAGATARTATSAPPAPGEWALRQTVGTEPVTDSRGRVWAPATGLSGGRHMPAWGGISGSASEQLYRNTRVGVRSWTVAVPRQAAYAVDVLLADTYDTEPGSRVFDIRAADGAKPAVTLAAGVDVVRTAGGWRTYHITGVLPVRSGRLVLTFVASRGEPIVNGLSVQTYGPAELPQGTIIDGFSGPAGTAPVTSLWNQRVGPGPWGDGELQAYTASRTNSAVTGTGKLALTARREHYSDRDGSQEYTSARLDTKGRLAITYGSISAKIKVPSGAGLWPAFWTLGTNQDEVDWPRCGELDIMEWLGRDPHTVVGSLHSYGEPSDRRGWRDQPITDFSGSYRHAEDLSADYHVYGMRVMPDAVTFTIDGLQYATVTPADLRSGQQWFVGQPQYLILNLAVGGTWGGPPTAATKFPATMLIDWIRTGS